MPRAPRPRPSRTRLAVPRSRAWVRLVRPSSTFAMVDLADRASGSPPGRWDTTTGTWETTRSPNVHKGRFVGGDVRDRRERDRPGDPPPAVRAISAKTALAWPPSLYCPILVSIDAETVSGRPDDPDRWRACLCDGQGRILGGGVVVSGGAVRTCAYRDDHSQQLAWMVPIDSVVEHVPAVGQWLGP